MKTATFKEKMEANARNFAKFYTDETLDVSAKINLMNAQKDYFIHLMNNAIKNVKENA